MSQENTRRKERGRKEKQQKGAYLVKLGGLSLPEELARVRTGAEHGEHGGEHSGARHGHSEGGRERERGRDGRKKGAEWRDGKMANAIGDISQCFLSSAIAVGRPVCSGCLWSVAGAARRTAGAVHAPCAGVAHRMARKGRERAAFFEKRTLFYAPLFLCLCSLSPLLVVAAAM